MATYNVSNSSQLKSALGRAHGGDTIHLSGGSYGKLELSGSFGNVTIKGGGNAKLSDVTLQNVSGLTFDNVTFSGAANGLQGDRRLEHHGQRLRLPRPLLRGVLQERLRGEGDQQLRHRDDLRRVPLRRRHQRHDLRQHLPGAGLQAGAEPQGFHPVLDRGHRSFEQHHDHQQQVLLDGRVHARHLHEQCQLQWWGVQGCVHREQLLQVVAHARHHRGARQRGRDPQQHPDQGRQVPAADQRYVGFEERGHHRQHRAVGPERGQLDLDGLGQQGDRRRHPLERRQERQRDQQAPRRR